MIDTIEKLRMSLYTFPCLKCGYLNVYDFPYYDKDKFKCMICNRTEKYFSNELNRIRINDFLSHIIIFLEIWEKELKSPTYTTKLNAKTIYLEERIRYKQLLSTSKTLFSSIEEFIMLCESRLNDYVNNVIRPLTKLLITQKTK